MLKLSNFFYHHSCKQSAFQKRKNPRADCCFIKNRLGIAIMTIMPHISQYIICVTIQILNVLHNYCWQIVIHCGLSARFNRALYTKIYAFHALTKCFLFKKKKKAANVWLFHFRYINFMYSFQMTFTKTWKRQKIYKTQITWKRFFIFLFWRGATCNNITHHSGIIYFIAFLFPVCGKQWNGLIMLKLR